ncbi:MAG TPA: hypothetical protein DHV72_24380 [Serratia grimesii]|uniref:Uncharacterized protein n=1 Tax=Serratia grimesii TaxID=82995 RepID=A0A9C7VA91_9GAMM|nr:hypothetical protein [Serratia grimesii]
MSSPIPRRNDELFLNSSYFKLHRCWLRLFTRITYLCKLIGLRALAAPMPLELFRVHTRPLSAPRPCA